MTTTALKKRTILDALIFEPIELVTAQPPQIFISIASGYLIAAEATVLLPFPFNVLLAAGAEWGYLRGLASGANVETAWKDRLTYANGALVILYGALFSLRKFGALPAVEAYQSGAVETGLLGAIVMTLIHIVCIGAVTICAMMTHAVMLAHEASVKRKHEEEVAARERRLQAERDALTLEWERKQQDLALWEQAQEAKTRLKMQSAGARTKMRRDALPASTNADPQTCPKCGAALDRPRWLAARRWGYCAACKGQS